MSVKDILELKRTKIMGILNLTPDSFSDGGKFNGANARERAMFMIEEGADLIDIGAESTRPGYEVVPAEEEIKRLEAFCVDGSFSLPVPVSVDTYKAETARWALAHGADIINDIKGLEAPGMAEAIAEYDAVAVIMHSVARRTELNIIDDVSSYLAERANYAISKGIKKENIILDPGVGFSKNTEENIQIIKHIGEFNKLGYPVLLGASRKSVIGNTLNLPVTERTEATVAISVLAAMAKTDYVRVHDVKENVRAVRMAEAIING